MNNELLNSRINIYFNEVEQEDISEFRKRTNVEVKIFEENKPNLDYVLQKMIERQKTVVADERCSCDIVPCPRKVMEKTNLYYLEELYRTMITEKY